MSCIEKKSSIPVTDSYDVVVCGGGIAGISAALAAARHGAKTLLVEREYALGGLATLGLIAIYLPISDGEGHQYSFGIAEELLKLCEKHGYISYRDVENEIDIYGKPLPEMKHRIKVLYDPNVYAIDTEQLLLDAGVKILYGTSVTDTVNCDDRITHLILENRDGKSAVSVKNVVDATGDAVVISAAGEKTADYKKGNILASWYYKLFNSELELVELGFSDNKKTPDAAMTNKKAYVEYDTESVTDFVIDSHASSLNHFLMDGNVSKDHCMTSIATVPQLRMTRRIDGKYTQTLEDFGKEYSDSIGMFVRWNRKYGEPYELPYRCLVGSNIKNIIAAGRCVSSADDIWNLTRVIPVCAVSGQAAGTAAAILDNLSEPDIEKLQTALKNDGVKLHEKDI